MAYGKAEGESRAGCVDQTPRQGDGVHRVTRAEAGEERLVGGWMISLSVKVRRIEEGRRVSEREVEKRRQMERRRRRRKERKIGRRGRCGARRFERREGENRGMVDGGCDRSLVIGKVPVPTRSRGDLVGTGTLLAWARFFLCAGAVDMTIRPLAFRLGSRSRNLKARYG